MPDIDAIHPKLGYITPEKTPAISQLFGDVAGELKSEGGCWSGDPATGWLDCSESARLVAAKLGLMRPTGYFSFDEYREALEGQEWDNSDASRMAEAFVKVCIAMKLDFEFS